MIYTIQGIVFPVYIFIIPITILYIFGGLFYEIEPMEV